ncbi:MAG: hypothetical protein M0Z52_03740 [Actinomycetota bacterium]|nr:hypothetical protein [Nitrospiraceae bacterium]MDA8155555.1 hypothetical protein [Actinomycetota bacterium]
MAMVASILYLTEGQRADIGGINFFAVRFIEIAGFIRITLRKEITGVQFNDIDKSFLIFQSVLLLVFLVRSFVNPASSGHRAYRIGFFCDALTTYFIFRSLIIDTIIFRNFLKKLSLLIIPFAVLMIIESRTGRNPFASMGGVPAVPVIRNGHFRAQGSFGVAITAGSFGATLMPLFISAILVENRRLWGFLGIGSCIAIAITAHSGGPVLAFVAAVIAWFSWIIREWMRMVRRGMLFLAVLLQLVMKAPIWFVLARVSNLTGGHGWDRANLIDHFAKNFWNWWLIGMPMASVNSWNVAKRANGMVDVLNTYVSTGITGGLLALILFIVLIVKCFKSLGISMRLMRSKADLNNEIILWGAGCCLFSHIINIIGVTYFDQIFVMWYMVLALISSLTAYCRDTVAIADENEEAIHDDLADYQTVIT